MEEKYEEAYHEVERSHWWFKTRRKIILKMLGDLDRNSRVLDIGSSSGLMLEELRDVGFDPNNLYGVDISEKAIANCKKNGFDNAFVMDAHKLTLEQGSFDLIIASDCLEHLERDREALDNWRSLLKEGGSLIVFVPAFQFLWSYHDDMNFHFRRYTNKELRTKLSDSGFDVKRTGYWNFFLFFPIALVRLLGNLFKSSSDQKEVDGSEGDLAMPGKAVNSLFGSIISVENSLIPGIRFPFGVSTFCIAKK